MAKQQYIIVYDWFGEVTEHERLFGIIFSLCVLNKTTRIDIGNAYLSERLKKTERTVQRWIADMIDEGIVSVDVHRGRSARNTYQLNMTRLSYFLDDKTRQVLQENTTGNTTGLSDFNINIKNKYNNNIISSFDASTKGEEDGQEIVLFKEDEIINSVSPETKQLFNVFWKKFNPIDSQKRKYKLALAEFSQMDEIYQRAAIAFLDKFGKPAEPNPYFYLQHFSPIFLDERQCYEAYKQHVQLCRVRYQDRQPICSAWMAELFKLTVLDDHYEKKFEL